MPNVSVVDDSNTAPPGWTEYWASCADCGWTGPGRTRHIRAREDAQDHQCPVPR
jgi:hypothetical protein